MNLISLTRRATLGAAAAACLLLAGCDYFYTATIQGYVIDDNTNNGTNGINNATIWLYDKDPGTVAESATEGPTGFFAKTSTGNQGNNAGFYSAKVVWNNPTGKYGAEGDTTQFWVVITHENYKTSVKTLPGILSKSTNTVPDLRLKRATFTAPLVRGQVRDANGNGVDGVRVTLTLYPSDSDPAKATNEDYVATTATTNNVPGTWSMNDVTWKDVTATGVTDSQTVKVQVTDAQYSGSGTLSPSLTSGSDNILSDFITVTRKPRYDFSTTMRGRILKFAKGTNDSGTYTGAAGVTVTVTFTNGDTGLTAQTVTAQTNAQGDWTLNLSWHDATPRNYDSGASDSSTTDTTLPEGEDGLLVTVAFSGLPTKDLGATLNLVQFNGMTPRTDTVTIGDQDSADTTASYASQKVRSDQATVFPDGVLDLQ